MHHRERGGGNGAHDHPSPRGARRKPHASVNAWRCQRERERQEQARRCTEALKASRRRLLAIVEDWSLARSIESFFEKRRA